MTGNREYPGEAQISEGFGFRVVGEKPAELNAPLLVIDLMNDLFRAGELLVASNLTHGFAEAGRGESGQRDGIEVLRLELRAELKTYGWVKTVAGNRSPQGEQLFSGYQNAGLVEKAWH